MQKNTPCRSGPAHNRAGTCSCSTLAAEVSVKKSVILAGARVRWPIYRSVYVYAYVRDCVYVSMYVGSDLIKINARSCVRGNGGSHEAHMVAVMCGGRGGRGGNALDRLKIGVVIGVIGGGGCTHIRTLIDARIHPTRSDRQTQTETKSALDMACVECN